jgi:hypothetical protein
MARFLFLVVCIVFPLQVSSQVIVNEIAWMGGEVEGIDPRQWWRYEWLELYNVSDTSVSVEGWRVELHRDNLDFFIELRGVIAPNEYYVVAASNKIKNADFTYNSLVGKFVNDGQRMLLRDKNGDIVEEIDASKGWFAGDNESKLTMERRFPEQDARDAENWGSSLRSGGSPKAANSIFGKEAVLHLDTLASAQQITKKDPKGSFFSSSAMVNVVFIKAILLAFLSSLSVFLLRRYLQKKDASSFDVPRG